jgi:hypothetical protein
MNRWKKVGNQYWLMQGGKMVASLYSDAKYRVIGDDALFQGANIKTAKKEILSAWKKWLKSANLQEISKKAKGEVV